MKLTLGTVQFGLPYEINNSSGIPIDDEIKQIFSIARDAGIQIVDTTITYGNAEEKIGQYSGGRFKIITKLPIFPGKTEYSYKWLTETINGSLRRLETNKLYGLLLHKPSQLLEKSGTNFYNGTDKVKL